MFNIFRMKNVLKKFTGNVTDVEMQDMHQKTGEASKMMSQTSATWSDTALLVACNPSTSGDPSLPTPGNPLPTKPANPLWIPSDRNPKSTSQDPSPLAPHPSSPYIDVSLTLTSKQSTKKLAWSNLLKNAIEKRDLPAVQQHLEKGESLKHFLRYGVTPLHLCIDLYCKDDIQKPLTTTEWTIFSAILAVTKHQELMEQRDSLHETALYAAIRSGHLNVVQACLAVGAQVHNISFRNDTALHIAVKHPHILRHFLINRNIVNSKNDIAYFPIHKAVEYGNAESIELLLDQFGEDQLTWRTKNNQTLLHLAACNGYVEVVRFLLNFIPSHLNIHETDDDHETAVYKASERGQEPVAALLLNHGAVLPDKGKNGTTVVKQIATKFSDPLTFLGGVFDECIYESSDYYNGRKKVCVDYEVLSNKNYGVSQMKMLQALIRCDLSELLAHPMVKSLIYLKWRSVMVQFYVLIAIHATTLAAFHTIKWAILTGEMIYITQSPLFIISSYCCIIILLARECINLKLQRWRYFTNVETYYIIPGLLLVVAAFTPSIAKYIEYLLYIIITVLQLLFWLHAIYISSRLPLCGHFVYFIGIAVATIIKIPKATTVLLILITSTVSIFLSPDLWKKINTEFYDVYGTIFKVLFFLDLFVLYTISMILVIASWVTVVASIVASGKIRDGNLLSLKQQVDAICTIQVINHIIILSALGNLKKFSAINRQHYCKIEKYISNSDSPWAVLVSRLNRSNSRESVEKNEVLYETLNWELEKDIINAAIKNEAEKIKK